MEKRDFNPESLREEFLSWKLEVQTLALKEKEGREELELVSKERDAFKHELYEQCLPRLDKMMNLQQQMVQSYQALLPAIETKKRLALEVDQLKEKLQEREKIHTEELSLVSSQLEASIADEQIKHQQMIEKARTEAFEKDAAHGKEVEALRAELQITQEKHKEEISQIRKRMHDEVEHLRNRIAQLQQMRSSCATSNMDFFASKLQATKEEYLKQIEDRDATITKLREDHSRLLEERSHYKEALMHQKLLSVVRGAVTAKETPTPVPTPVLSPKGLPMLENPQGNEKKLDKKDGEATDSSESDTGISQPKENEKCIDNDPIKSKEPKIRRLTKRKLFAIEKSLMEMDA